MAVQYCAKVMQTNFDEIPGFSKKFHLKRYFDKISPHFRDTYCFDLRDFSNDNSVCSLIHPKFSHDNSLLSKSRCDFSNDNSLVPKIQSIVYQYAKSIFETQFTDWNTKMTFPIIVHERNHWSAEIASQLDEMLAMKLTWLFHKER